MEFTIRKCTSGDAGGRGYVHYQSWKETYTGLMPSAFLNELSMEELQDRARRNMENTFVAIADNRVIGFGCYIQESREFVSIRPSAEIVALYVLKEYQGVGVGTSLINAITGELTEKNIILYVLEGNNRAMKFYEHIGFRFTGKYISQEVAGGTIRELEMVLER